MEKNKTKKTVDEKRLEDKIGDQKIGRDQLVEEAKYWSTQESIPSEWYDDPEAIPRFGEVEEINIYLPTKMLDILKEFARRNNTNYKVLIKRWLDDCIREEAEKFINRRKEKS